MEGSAFGWRSRVIAERTAELILESLFQVLCLLSTDGEDTDVRDAKREHRRMERMCR